MGDGENIQTELTSLYKMGAVTFPHGANGFADAASQLHKTGEEQEMTFKSFGDGSGVTALSEAFSSLRNMMQDEVLVATSNNLTKAGQALVQIATDYSNVDDEAKNDLEQVKKYLADEGTPEGSRPPDEQKDAPSSDDPH